MFLKEKNKQKTVCTGYPWVTFMSVTRDIFLTRIAPKVCLSSKLRLPSAFKTTCLNHIELYIHRVKKNQDK